MWKTLNVFYFNLNDRKERVDCRRTIYTFRDIPYLEWSKEKGQSPPRTRGPNIFAGTTSVAGTELRRRCDTSPVRIRLMLHLEFVSCQSKFFFFIEMSLAGQRSFHCHRNLIRKLWCGRTAVRCVELVGA